MTLFADNPQMTDEEAEQLFSAGVSLCSAEPIRQRIHALTVSPSRISDCCITRRCAALW